MSDTNVCKRCNKTVTTGLKCRTCGIVSHRSCLKTINAKFLDDFTVDCCINQPMKPVDTTNTNINIDVEKSVDQIKVTYLEEIIRQKDLLINNQEMLIKSLQAQISLLNQQMSTQTVLAPTAASSNSYAKVTANNKNKQLAKTETVVKQNQKPSTSLITPSNLSHAIHTTQTSKMCQEIINLTNDVQVGTKRNSRNLLVGNAESHCDNVSFKSAKYTRMRHFHVTNCDPATTKDALKTYLTEFIPEVQIEVLTSRNPTHYSSFKISVPSSEASKILKAELWPSGVVVNKFFHAKRQTKDSK